MFSKEGCIILMPGWELCSIALIGAHRKFLFLCIYVAEAETDGTEKGLNLMELATLKGNKNILSRLSVITTTPEKTDSIF